MLCRCLTSWWGGVVRRLRRRAPRRVGVGIVRSMARWRPPPGVEPPGWLGRYVTADWTDLDAWLAACSGWFDAHPEADAAHRWEWVLSIPDARFDPYGES